MKMLTDFPLLLMSGFYLWSYRTDRNC